MTLTLSDLWDGMGDFFTANPALGTSVVAFIIAGISLFTWRKVIRSSR